MKKMAGADKNMMIRAIIQWQQVKHGCVYLCMYVFKKHVCVYVCIYVCNPEYLTYVCMYVCI